MPTIEFAKTAFPTNGALQSNFGLGTYTAVPNSSPYQIGFQTSGAPSNWLERACFTHHDTSSLGAGAVVTQVKVRWRITTTTSGIPAPTTWAFRVRMGLWLGATLDATAGDFTPTLVQASSHTHSYPGAPSGIYEITLPAGFNSRINLTGFTDCAWKDSSSFTFGQDHFQTFTHSTVYPRVIVTIEGGQNPGLGGKVMWTP